MTAPPALAREEANLYNPSFLALLARQVSLGHAEKAQHGLPWSLVYLAIPTVLHKPAREALPHSTRTSMPAWTEEHPLIVESISQLAVTFQPLVRGALLFGLSHGLLELDGSELMPGKTARRRKDTPRRPPTDDFKSCALAATKIGRWYGVSGLPSTIFALWGVRP